jgi:hypothetical protein
VFGFSSGSAFTISNFAREAIALVNVTSGIGLTVDAWFLLAYCNAIPVKFQVSPLFLPSDMEPRGLTSCARYWP